MGSGHGLSDDHYIGGRGRWGCKALGSGAIAIGATIGCWGCVRPMYIVPVSYGFLHQHTHTLIVGNRLSGTDTWRPAHGRPDNQSRHSSSAPHVSMTSQAVILSNGESSNINYLAGMPVT